MGDSPSTLTVSKGVNRAGVVVNEAAARGERATVSATGRALTVATLALVLSLPAVSAQAQGRRSPVATPTVTSVSAVEFNRIEVAWSWTDTRNRGDNKCEIEEVKVAYRQQGAASGDRNVTGLFHLPFGSNLKSPVTRTETIGPSTVGTGSGESGVTLAEDKVYEARVQVTGAVTQPNCYYFSDWSAWESGPALPNRAPTVASAIGDQTVAVDGTTTVALASVFNDADNDSLELTSLIERLRYGNRVHQRHDADQHRGRSHRRGDHHRDGQRRHGVGLRSPSR